MSRYLRVGARLKQALSRPSMAIVGISFLVTFAVGVIADHQNRLVHLERLRTDVAEQLSLVRARLEGSINNNIQLVRGLVAVIESQSEIDQAQFSNIAANLIGDHSQLRNVAAAPDLVIRLMYPIEGNEEAIGLDYRKNEVQREAALRAVESRQMVLAGPVDLVQGGQGFIGRFPVFKDERLWGLVSAVVDVERLYADSGLQSPDLPIDIAIAGRDATGENGEIFYGSPDVFDRDPVLSVVSLPNGSWRMAAIPKKGWSLEPAGVWQFRALILAAGLVVVLPVAMAGYLYDQRRAHMRELSRRQVQLEILSQRLKLALDTSKIGIWELNLDTQELTWDRRMKELYGLPRQAETVCYEDWAGALHPNDKARAELEFDEAIASNGTYTSEFRIVLPGGAVRSIRAIGAVHIMSGGSRYIIGVNWDVSSDIELKKNLVSAKQSAEVRNRELEAARAQMEHASLHDSLTDLPNRRYLDKLLSEGIDGEKVSALLHIDLDRFKHINDTMGHAAGDAMLVHAASVLKNNCRSSDFVARIGGDEFVIAVTSAAGAEGLAELAARIIEQMREPVSFDGAECRSGVSIGIATADHSVSDYGKRLLIDADIALYRAKSNGRNRFEFFSASLKAEIVRNKRLADEILRGLDRNEFIPYFQPQFEPRGLKIVGVEALARWKHPSGKIMAPDMFLKTAEELDVVSIIDRAILEQALWQSTRWRSAGIDVPRISVNVSAGRLYDPRLIDSLEGLPIEPGRVSFELLESIFLDEKNDTIARNFDRLSALGIDVEIDDFGTGYTSIVSLIHLRPKRLKIDRQLVSPIVTSLGQRRLVNSIIDIGHSLGIEVVAEGVETKHHADILAELGSDALQGYAFAEPMTATAFMKFVREERWRDVA